MSRQGANASQSMEIIPKKSGQYKYNGELSYNDEETAILNENLEYGSGARSNFYDEPLTHTNNRPFFLKLCMICWSDRKNKLSRDELYSYNKLREEANTTFDTKCEDYDDLFRELYELLTNETLENIQNERWKDFGFQNSNPRSDIRGGGLLALKHLISFTEKYLARIKFMVVKENDFFLAISSISVSYFLMKYYHLPKFLLLKEDRKDICSRKALKSFCVMLEQDSKTLDKIHSMLLNDLYDTWQEIRRKVPGVTILDFGMAQDTVKRKYKDLTKSRSFTDFEELKEAYLKMKVKLPTQRPSLLGIKK